MPIDWPAKIWHLLLTTLFSLAVAGLQWAFDPQRPLAPLIAYSVAIGWVTWAVIDLGRHGFASSHETGWPAGWQGLALVAVAIGLGYGLGNALGDLVCRHFGLYRGGPPLDVQAEVRRGLLVTVLAGAVGSFLFYIWGKSSYLQRQMAAAKSQATEAQLKLLQSQLEPHMLFNTLANLRALIATDPSRAQTMLDHLNAFLRATLEASRTSQHPLGTEFKRLEDYLELMAVRMGARLRHSLDLPDDLRSQPVPPLLLQPLVENAIRHGLEPQVGGGELSVQARREGRQLVLLVQDSGAGVTTGLVAGFGITQVRDRLTSTYGAAAGLTIAAAPGGGTLARIHLPLAA